MSPWFVARRLLDYSTHSFQGRGHQDLDGARSSQCVAATSNQPRRGGGNRSLLDHHTCQQIASILNERGLCSGEGKTFSVRIVARIQKRYGLMPRCDRLRKAGMLTVKEMAAL